MFSIDIDNIKVLYTGDYSLEEDRHLIQAELPTGAPPDVLIVESTFGTTNLPSREKREADFTRTVESIVLRGGSCLIPVFALGRAQELLLILDNYWKNNAELQHIPIFYASKLAARSLRVYQTFVNMMNSSVRALADRFQNPFQLQHIRSLGTADFQTFGPSVVMASPGFLQSGVSRQLFEAWCDEERHGVIIAGYTVEGTLAHELLNMPHEIRCLDNRIKPRRCQIEHISFSAHVDYSQNRRFIRSVRPDYIVLVHGEKTQMRRLKDALETEARQSWPTLHKPSIATPENGVKVRLRFRKNVVADVLGRVAVDLVQAVESRSSQEIAQESPALPAGTVLVTENFSSRVMSAQELPQFTPCRLSAIYERLVLPVPQDICQLLYSTASGTELQQQEEEEEKGWEGSALAQRLICQQLAQVYDEVHCMQQADGVSCVTVQEIVRIQLTFSSSSSSGGGGNGGHEESKGQEQRLSALTVCWTASPVADVLADSIVGLLAQMLSAPSLVRRAVAMAAGRERNAAAGGKAEGRPVQRRRIATAASGVVDAVA
jgi:hypothetical protein